MYWLLDELKANGRFEADTTPELAHLLSGTPVIKMGESDFDFIIQVVIEGSQTTLNILKSIPSTTDEKL